MASESLLCVAPISPTYSPTHRYLFYISHLISILYPTPPPLVKGAFAFSLTYSATAALYAILHLSNNPPSSPPFATNLDIPPLLTILSASTISLLPLQIWTKSLSPSAHNILRLWGLFIASGTCCAFTLLVRAKAAALSSPTAPHAATIDDCRPDPGRLRLRSPHHLALVPLARLFGPHSSLLTRHTSFLVFVPMLFGVLSCIYADHLHRTPDTDYAHGESLSSPRDPISCASRADAATALGLGSSSSSATATARFSLKALFLALRKAVLDVSGVCYVVVVVVGEVYMLADGRLPEVEGMGEVGQWGVLAGLGFVAVAAGWDDVVRKERTEKTVGDAAV